MNNKKRIIIYGISLLTFFAIILGISLAFFNYTRTGEANSLASGQVKFDTTGTLLIDVSNDFPYESGLTQEAMNTMKNSHKGTLTITGHTTLTDGVKYRIYAVRGDAITGKLRLNDENINIQLTPNFVSGSNGFTVKTNDYAEANHLIFDNDGKALLSTGIVKDTQELTSVTYDYYMWIDGDNTLISSTTKRATLAEGNPSLADTTSGNTTADRYMKNSNVLTQNVTIFPAKSTDAGKTVYTTNEFSNGYYNIKIVVEAEDAMPTGEDKVLAAIEAKKTAETNSCNPVWVDDNGTANDESDDITYFSGTNDCVDMNYVWYSGKLWRITAIYPDGAMKLVTENNITSIAFNASNQVNFYTDANTTSYMYQWLNEDFYDTLYNANQLIDTSKQWNATMPSDTNVSTKPQETNMVTANVGLLNNYEYYNSYRCISSATCTGTSYSTGYLNIGYYWWLLNPYDASYVWVVDYYGIGYTINTASTNGSRPSIYLKSGLEFTGNGTKQSPYKIVGDKDTGTATELVNTRMSGEYVKLKNGNNEQVFRIIGVEENKTKIIAMDYADYKAKKKFATSDGSANTLWGSGTTTDIDTWYTYLNTTSTGYFDTLKSTYGELFDSGLYYLGTSEYNYKLSVCANTTSGNTKVCDKTSDKGTFNIGLPRHGEMFATQQSGGYSNSIDMWLMNRSISSSRVWYVDNGGSGRNNIPTSTRGSRPTVHLKSSVKIISGTGTETDPYVVGL